MNSTFDQFTEVSPSTGSLTLSPEQLTATDLISAWFRSGSNLEFRLGGYAGTGKTTIQKVIREILKTPSAVCAFTGKAVNVLQRKGISDAATIHSTIYNCEQQPDGTWEFFLRNRLEGNPKLIIIDEASMISRQLYDDLVSFDIPLLFVGDPGQLEPIENNPNLMAKPDFTLQTIHRQAESSPIIQYASSIRHGQSPKSEVKPGLEVRSKVGFDVPLAATFDQVICAKNKTRMEINRRFRGFMGRQGYSLEKGDKIIVLRNNMTYAVFNGMILFVDEVLDDCGLFSIINSHDEINRPCNNLRVWNEPFQRDIGKDFVVPKHDRVPLVYADWGYCITCHKSQGSEWDRVLLWDEWMHPSVWDMRRWRYTGITRASKHLTHCL